jgi:anionic cell wall polymer biosynthesis LytR-Cps2A-Psr (LCP) family protein
MKKHYNAEPGFLTVNQAVDRIINALREDDNRKIKGIYYRELIKLSQKKILKNKKNGRNYWIDEKSIDEYIQNKIKMDKYSKKATEVKNNEISTDNIKEIISLLEKAEVPPEKILKIIKEALNIRNDIIGKGDI